MVGQLLAMKTSLDFPLLMHFLVDLYPRQAFPLLKTSASFELIVSDVFFDFFGILDIFLIFIFIFINFLD